MIDRNKHLIVAFEGIDHSGKTTQAELLYKRIHEMQGYGRKLVNFPSDTLYGTKMRNYLHGDKLISDLEFELVSALDKYKALERIEAMMATYEIPNQRTIFIFNRYYLSQLVYGTIAGFHRDFLLELSRYLPRPHITFILDIPAHISMERSRNNEEKDIYEKDEELLKKARALYIDMDFVGNGVIISGKLTVQEIHDYIIKELETQFPDVFGTKDVFYKGEKVKQ